MKIVSLDVGSKTIGVAIGFSDRRITQPILTLQRKSVKKDALKLQELCRKEAIDEIVVGLPLELSGEEGRSARLARQIGLALGELSGLPVHYQDERYSTVEAENRLREAGKTARQQKEMIDQVAAMVILEDWWRSQSPST